MECSSLAAPLGLYSHVSRVKSGNPVYIAGQVGVDAQGRLVGPDFSAQMRQTFENLRIALKAAGGTFADVAKFTTYVTRDTDLPAFMQTREEIFANLYPTGSYPPNTLLVINRLVKPELLIEIEAIAVV
ncbi:MAG TPA: RidA family protein [Candidatus Acidoferrales bacterium]|nr:RidA family protein [Candidatus Acidoferrales bacterium]